ncbi:MAG: hypothetical protein AAGD11_04120 [Planctomycetota bacterium]
MDTPDKEAHVEFSAPSQSSGEQPTRPSIERSTWIEVLVDPRTLQGLMCCGGGLLVLGLVIWLWAIGLFENKLIVASCLGVANFGLLSVGLGGSRFSRYQTASKALTMLACLVMPLNLWFYDAQGLITLDQGGHLWVPALVCCALYVAVARLSADPLYVHAIVGGVTMTGLLILADHQVSRLWEIMAPSSFLVILGIVCIHFERAFPPEEGRFSRDNFGRAFFNSGHAVMGLGLLVLLLGRLVGRLYDPYLSNFDWAVVPEVAVQTNLRLWAIALAIGATYSYLYSQLVVQPKGRYMAPALLSLVWAAIMAMDLLQIPLTADLVMLLLAVGSLATSLIPKFSSEPDRSESEQSPFKSLLEPLRQDGGKWASVLNAATFTLGVGLFAQDRLLSNFWDSRLELSLLFVFAAMISGVASWLPILLNPPSPRTRTGNWRTFHGAVLVALALNVLIERVGISLSMLILSLEMLIPLVIALVAIRVRSDQTRRQLALVAETMSLLFLLLGTGATFGLIHGVRLTTTHLGVAMYLAVAATSLGISSHVSRRVVPAVVSAGCFSLATWQLLLGIGMTHNLFLISAATVGLACLATGRLLGREGDRTSQLATISQWIGRLSISYSSVATLMIALARLLADETHWNLLGMLAVQSAAAFGAGMLSKEAGWRRHFWVLTTIELLMFVLVANALTTLSFWQRGEMFLTVIGLAALVLGYIGWYAEKEREEDLVSFNLALGSLFSAVPLTIGMLVQRFDSQVAPWGWGLMHEAGVLSIGLLLLGAGVLCRIRWSTIVGGTTLLVYVTSLVGMIHLPEQLQTTAIYMMVGGGVFFGAALLLSIYRDRLLAIPQRVQDGEGVFRVLKWR